MVELVLVLVGAVFVLGIVVGLVVQEHGLARRERRLAAQQRALAQAEWAAAAGRDDW